MQILAVIRATSATAERCFSALKRVKIFLRSKMSKARLNSALLLHVHKELSPDIKSVMGEFIGLNDTRRRIFGDVV
jgi:hAT family C-terminal dimerisation region